MSTIVNKEGIQYDAIVTMETIICYKCAIPFAVPANYKRHLHSSQDNFTCPNGHSQMYTKSTETLLREKIERIEKEREANEAAYKERLFFATQEAANWKKNWENQLAEKKKANRALKRLNNGVCGCCNRTFQNLAEHIKSEHPELIGKEKPKRTYTKKQK